MCVCIYIESPNPTCTASASHSLTGRVTCDRPESRMTASARIRKVSTGKSKTPSTSKSRESAGRTKTGTSPSPSSSKKAQEFPSTRERAEEDSKTVDESRKADETSDSEMNEAFEDHTCLGGRISKTLYYANKLPSTPRPSFPLTGTYLKHNRLLSAV